MPQFAVLIYDKDIPFEEIPPEVLDRVGTAWRRSFDEWGYPLDPSEPAAP